ncbi:carboxypeptidase regulatory-like domain-containing protein [Wukongibacter sp. M2B1]|uniref:carboxypeptidase regulatory-like domain-containing protein n=1 Tax=Wukongibacter sp. M2B1 TaxID=3088895 RepID=UPI003D78F11D
MLKFKKFFSTALMIMLIISSFLIFQPIKVYSEEMVSYTVSFNTSAHTISGYVKDKVTDDPIENAKIMLNKSTRSFLDTKTDSKGYFKFENVLEDTYILKIEKEGYKEYDKTIKIDGNDLELDVSMGFYTISGYITDKMLDEPIENVKVKLNDSTKSSMETETDSKGYFEFKYLSQGSHTVKTEKEGYSNYEKKVKIDSEDVKLSLDIKSQMGPCIISGYVKDERTDIPVNNVMIRLDGSSNWVNETDDNGYFKFEGVTEGVYGIKFEKEGYYAYIKSLNVSGDDTELDVKLNSYINVEINNVNVEFDNLTGYPFIDENDRTLVPLRKVLESFGAQVQWDNDKKLVYVTKNNNTVYIPANESYIIVNDKKVAIDSKAIIKNEKTYCPIRAIVEGLGGAVIWDEETNSIVIKDKE